MSLIRQIENWSSSHNPKWLALLRVALGVLIFMRGVTFLNDQDGFETVIGDSSLREFSSALGHILPWIHIIGGFLIIMGVMTRITCFLQIPVVLGGIIFIHSTKAKELFAVETDLSFSLLILLLLIVFFIEGGGPLSLVNYLKNNE
jgi:putative oxidoreductase